MSDAVVNTGEVIEGNDWFLTYRLVRADGVYVAVDDVTAGDGSTVWLTVKAYQLGTSAAVAEEPAYSATVGNLAASIDNHLMIATDSGTLLTDGFWGGVDDTGYNFFYRVPYGTWMKGGNRYRIEFKADLTAADTDSAHGAVSYGSVSWASIIYVKSMTSIG